MEGSGIIDATNLRGIYFVRFVDKNGNIEIVKVVK
jgi:hypothetical protein